MVKQLTDAQLIEWGLHPIAITKDFLRSFGATVTLPERFVNKVSKSDGCWIFKQQVKYPKYPTMSRGGERTSMGAHVISYILHFGKFPNGKDVCHSCDNRACVNPKHLWLGTRWQNMKDCHSKGRLSNEYTISRKSRGESHAKAIFRDEQVLRIVQQNKDGLSYTRLAEIYRCSRSAIAFICSGKTWCHITGINSSRN